jgi:hypothetical protein
MSIPSYRTLVLGILLSFIAAGQCRAVELKVSREALQRTLRQQLFSGPGGRYYLKGDAQSPCYAYADDAQLSFVGDRVLVVIKTHAKIGKALRGNCLGLSLSSAPEVSLAPFGEGESIGFRDARLNKIVDQKEMNFLLTPFLSRQLPSEMKIDAADLLRKALEGSTASSGYKVTLDKLKIHSMQIAGDDLVVDVDGEIGVK